MAGSAWMVVLTEVVRLKVLRTVTALEVCADAKVVVAMMTKIKSLCMVVKLKRFDSSTFEPQKMIGERESFFEKKHAPFINH